MKGEYSGGKNIIYSRRLYIVQDRAVRTPWIGKDELHREMDLLGDAQGKIKMDKHQFARTHGFLVVNFPLKKLLPWLILGRPAILQLKLCMKPRWTMRPPHQKRWWIGITITRRFVQTELWIIARGQQADMVRLLRLISLSLARESFTEVVSSKYTGSLVAFALKPRPASWFR